MGESWPTVGRLLGRINLSRIITLCVYTVRDGDPAIGRVA